MTEWSFDRHGGNSMTPPVSEGEQRDVTIEAVGEKGDGMTKIEGFVVFVPGTKAGDRVKIKVTRVLSKVGFGEVVEQLGSSAKQEEPEEEFEANEHLDSEDFGEDED